jgi:signal transduction histidine kinase
LDDVIKDLNKILDIKSGKHQKIEPVSLDKKLAEVKKMLSKQITANEAIIKEDFTGIVVFESISPFVGSIMYNLISNAIKYRRPDVVPIISIKSYDLGKFVKITFEDNGLGIDVKRFRSKLFNLYNRFHDHIEGKGVGLYLVKTQAELLGGSVMIKSKLQVGTKFTVLIKKSQKLDYI